MKLENVCVHQAQALMRMRTVPVAWRKMGSRLMNEVVVCVLWNEA
jgi:hypothetical protein